MVNDPLGKNSITHSTLSSAMYIYVLLIGIIIIITPTRTIIN
jgi:hypothetical protein